jgi:hypothetical protein
MHGKKWYNLAHDDLVYKVHLMPRRRMAQQPCATSRAGQWSSLACAKGTGT